MNDRKQHVINKAHELFIDKGYLATSIQDILDYSGISKGTFYNYFSSKSELLIAIYKTIYKKLDKDRNDLLVGKDPADIEIFIKQIELQTITNRKNKLIPLYEEVMATNDVDLKQFIQRSRLLSLRWYFGRLIDIFGEDKRQYLLDCAIMFQGILQHNLQYNRMAHVSGEKISEVARYCVARLVNMVDGVTRSGDQLLAPQLLEEWLPGCSQSNHAMIGQIIKITNQLRSNITKSLQHNEQEPLLELLDFIQDEVTHTRSPRKYLIQSALQTLRTNTTAVWGKDLHQLQQQIENFIHHLDEKE